MDNNTNLPENADSRHRIVRAVLQDLLGMIESTSLDGILQRGLEEVVRLSGSRVGCLHTLAGTPGTIRLLNRVQPDQAANQPRANPELPLAADSYWAACLARREPILRNNLPGVESPLGPGHEPLSRDLTTPICEGDKIVAVLAVGNRSTDYGPAEAQLVWELAAGLWRVVVRKQVHDDLSDDVK